MSMSFVFTFNKVILISRLAIVSIGSFGNILSFIIFSRKTFRNNSISTYFRALAISELLLLVQLILDVYELIYKGHLHNVSDGVCKIMYYLSIQYGAIPGWILAAVSIDKMLSIRTHQMPFLKDKRFQWSVVAAIALFNLIFYVEILISLRLVPVFFFPPFYLCELATISYFFALIIAMIVESCLIPFLIMLVSSIVTIRWLFASRKRFGNVDKQRRNRDKKFAISSLILNVFYVLFKSPFFVFYIFYAKDPFSNTYYFFNVSFLLLLVNCSATFFIHLFTNSIFRGEFFKLFRLRCQRR